MDIHGNPCIPMDQRKLRKRDAGGELIEYDTARRFFEDPQHELTRAYISGLRG